MTTTIDSVAGSDGVVPIYNPDGLWANWALAQLFMGASSPGADALGNQRYVGKVFDYVTDYTTNQEWQITALDPTTLTPTLSALPATIIPPDIDTTDLLFGVGPGTQSDTYRVYYDDSVLPAKLTCDQRLQVNGVNSKYAKIFKGSVALGTAQVISAFYDASGNLLGENIPLELVAMPNGQNYAVYAVSAAWTKVTLANGELVTVVLYANDGSVVSERQCLIKKTAFMRSTNASAKYITGITLESPFLSTSNPNQLQFPLNVPMNSLMLTGAVHYSDGTELIMPVDGTKFSTMGLQNMVATIPGQTLPFTLRYNLSPGEIYYDAQSPDGVGAPFVTEPYEVVVQSSDGSYTVKLYCVPNFNTTSQVYSLDWYIYDLDRDLAQLVTPYVTYSVNGGSFNGNPAAYGQVQQLQVAIDLSNVSGQYKKYIFTQTFSITLYRAATDFSSSPWTISYSPGQTPQYGTGIWAKTNFVNQNLMYVDISQGLSAQADWLAAVLAPALPLYDPTSESTYPAPNYFSFVLPDGTEAEFPISQWNAQNLIDQALPNAGTLYLKFFQRTQENDLQIALCPMVIQQTD